MSKGEKRQRKLLGNSNHQLLGVKDVLDSLITEADSLPKQITEMLISVRDATWQAFVAEQEKTMAK